MDRKPVQKKSSEEKTTVSTKQNGKDFSLIVARTSEIEIGTKDYGDIKTITTLVKKEIVSECQIEGVKGAEGKVNNIIAKSKKTLNLLFSTFYQDDYSITVKQLFIQSIVGEIESLFNKSQLTNSPVSFSKISMFALHQNGPQYPREIEVSKTVGDSSIRILDRPYLGQ